jgi:hypothetical protein
VVINLKQHGFRRIFLIAFSSVGFIVSACSQQTAVNVAANADSSSKTLSSNQTTASTNVIRLAYQKGDKQVQRRERQTATVA